MYEKKYFQDQLIRMITPLLPFFRGGTLDFSLHSAWYENISADMEAFARPLWGLVPLWAGGGGSDQFEELYSKGLAAGSGKDSSGYWGACHERDQRYVEMAAIAYGLIFAPDKLWKPLSGKSKADLAEWLSQINSHEVCDSNWRFFRILVNIALMKTGNPFSKEKLSQDIARLDEFYLGDGWYRDGVHGQTDYYIAFAFHFYGLIYAIAMEHEDSDRCKLYKKRACEFAETFIYWFDDDGEALPYGRSLTYRFAQVSFWSACVIAGIRPFPLDVMKGIIVRNLEKWLSKKIFDHAGILSVGYDYPNLLMAEHYNAHGSPYWGLKAYAFLMLPDDHDFWKVSPAPMPKLRDKILIKQADMLITRHDGITTAYPGGNNEYFGSGQIIPKYLKFAYSAHFGFNVMRSALSLAEAAPDNMLVFELDGMIMVRRHFKSCAAYDDRLVIEWSPLKGIDVRTTVIPTRNGHIREHEIVSVYECAAYDAGFAVSSRDSDNCVSGEGESAYAKNDFQYCSVSSETDGRGIIIPAAPNTNIKFSKTLIPAAGQHINKGKNIMRTVIKSFLEV